MRKERRRSDEEEDEDSGDGGSISNSNGGGGAGGGRGDGDTEAMETNSGKDKENNHEKKRRNRCVLHFIAFSESNLIGHFLFSAPVAAEVDLWKWKSVAVAGTRRRAASGVTEAALVIERWRARNRTVIANVIITTSIGRGR